MKLTKKQQEMLDGVHGETKKFCVEKLVDFGAAVEATEMVDLSLVLCGVPIWSKDRRNPETLAKLNAYDLGHSPLYDPIFAMKDAHVADETGCVCGNDPYLCQFDKVDQTGYPWNFEIPGKGSFKLDEEMVRIMFFPGLRARPGLILKESLAPLENRSALDLNLQRTRESSHDFRIDAYRH